MTPLEAEKIIRSAQEPFSSYEVSFGGRSLVSADSFEGRVVSFIKGGDGKVRAERVKKIIRDALLAIPKTEENIRPLIKLYARVNVNDLSWMKRRAYPESALFKKEAIKVEASILEEEREGYPFSFLRTPLAEGLCAIGEKEAAAIFGSSEESRAYLEAFLVRNPGYLSAVSEQELARFTASVALGKEFITKVKTELIKKPKEEVFAEFARELRSNIRRLSLGQKYLYTGRYGIENPLSRLEGLLASYGDVEIPQISLEAIWQNVEEVIKVISSDEEACFLFRDSSRQMEERRYLPSCIKNWIENKLKKGAIENLSDWVIDREVKDWMAYIGKLGSKEMQEQAFKDLKKDLAPCLKYAEMDPVFELIEEVSPFLLALIDEKSSLASGKLWLEWTLEPDKTYTLFVYSSGAALVHHKDLGEGKIGWPLKIRGISQERLTEEFFTKLLSISFMTAADSKGNLDPKNIYKGLFAYLQGDSNVSCDGRALDLGKGEIDVEMVKRIHPDYRPSFIKFRMKLEALQSFYAGLIKDDFGLAFIEKEKTATLLEAMQSSLKGELETHKGALSRQDIKGIEGGLKEIEHSIKGFYLRNPKEVFSLEDRLLQGVKSALQSEDGSFEAIERMKSHLSWAFGEDVSKYADVCLETLDEIESAKVLSSTKKAEPRPIFWQGYPYVNKVYFFIRKVVSLLQSILLYPFSAIGSLIITYLLPAWVGVKVQVAKEEMQKLLITYVAHGALYCLPEQSAENIRTRTSALREFVRQKVAGLFGMQEVSYELSAPLEQEAEGLADVSQTGPEFSEVFVNSPEIQDLFSKVNPVEKVVSILECSKFFHSEHERLHYLVAEINSLEIPKRDVPGVWDEGAYNEDLLENLFTLQWELNSLHHSVHSGTRFKNTTSNFLGIKDTEKSNIYEFPMGGFWLANYTLLAINERIARKCPAADLEGYCIAPADFLLRLKRDLTFVSSEIERLEELLDYFFPGVNLKKLPSYREIKKMTEHGLFFEDMRGANLSYLTKRLQGAAVQETMLTVNWHTKEEWIEFLWKDARSLLNKENSFLPRAYVLLYNASLFDFVEKKIISMSKETLYLGDFFTPPGAFERIFRIVTTPLEVVADAALHSIEVVHDSISAPNPVTAIAAYSMHGYHRMWASKRWDISYEVCGKGQSELMAEESQSGFVECERSLEITQRLAYIRSEVREKTKRPGIGYTIGSRKDKSEEESYGHFRRTDIDDLEMLLKYKDLSMELKSNPSLALAIGETLAELVDAVSRYEYACTREEKYRLYYYGDILKRYVKKYTPQHLGCFPNFTRCVSSLKDFSFHKVFFLEFEELAEKMETQDEFLFDFGVAISKEKQEWLLSADRWNTYRKWLPKFLNALKEESFCLAFVRQIGQQRGVSQSELKSCRVQEVDDEWVLGSNFTIHFNTGMIIFQNEGAKEQSASRVDEGSSEKSEQVIPLDKKMVREILAPLQRFCDVENIKAYGVVRTSHISAFFIEEYGIKFSVERSFKGLFVAKTRLFPGYYIAPTQSFEKPPRLLGGAMSYLLLENERGGRKVLVPRGQWVGGFSQQITKRFGALSHVFAMRLPTLSQGKYYTYDIDSRTGDLYSEDPFALAYLLSLCVVQGNEKGAREACSDFERVARQKPISEEVLHELYPLFMPREQVLTSLGVESLGIKICAISYLRKRILAAMEENALVQVEKKPKKQVSFLDFLYIFNVYEDLSNNSLEKDPRKQITKYQEWSLYQGFLSRVREVMPEGIKELGLEELVLQGSLASRYAALKKQLNTNATCNWQGGVSGLLHLLFGESSMPPWLDKLLAEPSFSFGNGRGFQDLLGVIVKAAIDFQKKFPQEGFKFTSEVSVALPLITLTKESLKKEFLTYYAIAGGALGKAKKQRLVELLLLSKGGWDEETLWLTLYLESVADSPMRYEEVNELKKHSNLEKLHRAVVRNNLLSALTNIAAQHFASTVGNVALTIGSGVYKSYTRKMQYGVGVLSRVGKSCYSQVQELFDSQKKIASSKVSSDEYVDPSFQNTFAADLVEEEKESLEVLERLFSIAFSEKITEGKRSFYLKGYKELWTLYEEVSLYKEVLEIQLSQDKEELLSSINQGLKREGHFSPIEMEDLLTAFLQGKLEDIGLLSGFSSNGMAVVEKAIMRFLVRAIHLQQMTRVLAHFQGFSWIGAEDDPTSYERKLEQLADELKMRHGYSFYEIPDNLLRHFLLFEYKMSVMLWEKQAGAVKNVMEQKKRVKGSISELMMSLGKTWFCIPTLDAILADGASIVVNAWVSPMVETNTRLSSIQNEKVFHQRTHRLRFDRNIPFTEKNLRAILLLCRRAKECGEVINLSKEDAQALDLLFFDQLCKKGAPQMAEILAEILETLEEIGIVIADEAHEICEDSQELSYPLGRKKTISPTIYKAAEWVMLSYMKLSSTKEEESLSKVLATYHTDLKFTIARDLSLHRKLAIQGEDQRQEFILYVTGNCKKIPSWISSKDPAIYQEIAMAKGVLSILLPDAIAKRVGIDYGISLLGDGEFARPYEANQSPLEGATSKNPHEALIRTFIQYRKTGLSIVQAKRLLNDWRITADALAKSLFSKISEGRSLSEYFLLSEEKQQEILQKAMQSPDAIAAYIEKYIRETIPYWSENITSNAQNFASEFAIGHYDTGTPYNLGSYPDELAPFLDPTAEEDALRILESRCPKDGIHILKGKTPKDILWGILERFFAVGSDFTALIDGGGLMCGFNNEEVAIRILVHAQKYRPDIKGVHYYQRQKTGGELLVTMETGGGGVSIPHDTCSLKPEQCLSYFDQKHGFASNIPQKFNGTGLLLLGPGHKLYKLLQEAFRMRGVKDEKRLSLQETSDRQTQSIQIAMTQAVVEEIAPEGEIPTLKEIREFAINNQIKQLKLSNYNSYRQKIANILRKQARKKILSARISGKDAMVSALQKSRDLFISQCEEDPKVLYGGIFHKAGSTKVLSYARAAALKKAEGISLFTADDIRDIKQAITGLRVYPVMDEIEVYTIDGKNFYLDKLDDLNQGVHHSVNQNEDQDQDQEQHLEHRLHVMQQTAKVDSFTEWGWDKGDWNPYIIPRVIRDTSTPSKLSSWGLLEGAPAVFSVDSLLARTENRLLKSLSRKIDNRIWYSNNFLPQVFRGFFGFSPVEICSKGQRDLSQVVIHFTEEKEGISIHSVGALSIRDAALWKERLSRKKKSSIYMKTVLYDIRHRVPLCGSAICENALRKHPDFLLIESHLKFLNGDLDYHEDQISVFIAWAKSQVDDLYALVDAIRAERGKSSLAGTSMELILASWNGSFC